MAKSNAAHQVRSTVIGPLIIGSTLKLYSHELTTVNEDAIPLVSTKSESVSQVTPSENVPVTIKKSFVGFGVPVRITVGLVASTVNGLKVMILPVLL